MKMFIIGLVALTSISAFANDKNDLGEMAKLLVTIQAEKTNCGITDIQFKDLGSYAVLSFKTIETSYVIDTQSFGNWSGVKEVQSGITKRTFGFSKGISTPFSENNQQVSLFQENDEIKGVSLFQHIDTRRQKVYSVQNCVVNP